MTPGEFAFILWRCGMTQARAAERLGLTERQVRRYAGGRTPIPLLVEREIRRWTSKKQDDQDDTEEDDHERASDLHGE